VDLTLNSDHEADGSITLKANVEAVNPDDRNDADVFVALYENGLVTNV
jgi:hypothetical protein